MKKEITKFELTDEMRAQLAEAKNDVIARVNALPEVLRYTFARDIVIEMTAGILEAGGPEVTIEFLQNGIDSVYASQTLIAQVKAAMAANPSAGKH